MIEYLSRNQIADELGISYATLWRHQWSGLIAPPRVIIGLGVSTKEIPGWAPGDATRFRDATDANFGIPSGYTPDYKTLRYASKLELAVIFGIANRTTQTITYPPSVMVNTRMGWSHSDIKNIASQRGWSIHDQDMARIAGQ